MKILFAVRNPNSFLQYESVVRVLCRRGHSVLFHLASLKKEKGNLTDEALAACKKDYTANFDYCQSSISQGLHRTILIHTREMLNCSAYFRQQNNISTSPHMIKRALDSLPQTLRSFVRIPVLRRLLTSPMVVQICQLAEKYIPADDSIREVIEKNKPDLVVATPFIFSYSEDIDYVKSAKSLGIPTVVPIFSWDNLTTKGVFHILPDYVMTWNKFQIRELTEIHNVPESIALITGAPSLDHWFTRKPKQSYENFCKKYGLDPRKPFVSYLCSSWNVAPDEHTFVDTLITDMKSFLGAECPTILIRPHPLNTQIWNDFDRTGAVVLPKGQDGFFSDEGRNLFFSSLYHSRCILGINTTAMIETAIVDKPCLTILTPQFKLTQTDSVHFRHLRDSGFVHVTSSIEELCSDIKDILDGIDKYREQRQRFVHDFIKPWNKLNSTEAMASMLELCANRDPTEQIRDLIASLDV